MNKTKSADKLICVWYLPTTGGQPDGNVFEMRMTRSEYERRRSQGEYVYDDYGRALHRAQD